MFLSVGINCVCELITVLCKTTGVCDKAPGRGLTLETCGSSVFHLALGLVCVCFPMHLHTHYYYARFLTIISLKCSNEGK